ncbi:MAG: hypothetical protein KC501_31075 [Myxococcales bacterium]|nr:hypothetical protein [Myxococcales bacterium]
MPRTRYATTARCAVTLISLSLSTACADDPQGRPVLQHLQPGPADGDLVLAERAFRVDAEPETEVVVAPDSLVLDASVLGPAEGWLPGDLLVNGEGRGFLRRVVEVDEGLDQTVLRTEPAELSELVAQGGVHASLRPFSEGLRLDDDGGPSGLAFREGFGGRVELGPTTLVESGGLELALTGGHFAFDPTLDLDVDLGWWSIDRFEVLATGTLDAEIELRLGTDGNYEIVDRSMSLWESPRYAWYGFVGPVPVVVVSQLELGATVSARTEGPSSVTVGAGASSRVEVGAIYEDGWTMVGDHQFEARITGPTFVLDTELRARVQLDGTLKVELYDVVGPRLTLSPWSELRVDLQRQWAADLGVTGTIGGAISLPWHDDLSLDGTLFTWSHRLGEGQL